MAVEIDFKKDPMRRSLSFAAWPTADCIAWEAAITKGDVLDPGGAASSWRPSSVNTIRQSYGRFLSFAQRSEQIHDALQAAELVTPKNLASYVKELQTLNASLTVLSLVRSLYCSLKAMHPNRDWGWLHHIVKRLSRVATPVRDIRPRLVASTELYAFGLDLMESAESASEATLFSRAINYRDGLMISLLAARPFRVHNFAAIELDRHLVREKEGYWLGFDASETKNHKSIEVPFPATLTDNLERYVLFYRPLLFPTNRGWTASPSNADRRTLWISTQGKPMSENSVYERVTTITRSRFGWSINPHMFRHAAATTIAIDDPEHVYITRCLLGHTTQAMSEKYYNYARQLEASRRYQTQILSLRGGKS